MTKVTSKKKLGNDHVRHDRPRQQQDGARGITAKVQVEPIRESPLKKVGEDLRTLSLDARFDRIDMDKLAKVLIDLREKVERARKQHESALKGLLTKVGLDEESIKRETKETYEELVTELQEKEKAYREQREIFIGKYEPFVKEGLLPGEESTTEGQKFLAIRETVKGSVERFSGERDEENRKTELLAQEQARQEEAKQKREKELTRTRRYVNGMSDTILDRPTQDEIADLQNVFNQDALLRYANDAELLALYRRGAEILDFRQWQLYIQEVAANIRELVTQLGSKADVLEIALKDMGNPEARANIKKVIWQIRTNTAKPEDLLDAFLKNAELTGLKLNDLKDAVTKAIADLERIVSEKKQEILAERQVSEQVQALRTRLEQLLTANLLGDIFELRKELANAVTNLQNIQVDVQNLEIPAQYDDLETARQGIAAQVTTAYADLKEQYIGRYMQTASVDELLFTLNSWNGDGTTFFAAVGGDYVPEVVIKEGLQEESKETVRYSLYSAISEKQGVAATPQDLVNTLAALTVQSHELERSNQQLQAEIKKQVTNTTVVDTLTEQNKGLVEKLQKATTRITELEGKNRKLETQTQVNVGKAVEDKQQIIDGLNSELEARKQELQVSQENARGWQSRLETLETYMQKLLEAVEFKAEVGESEWREISALAYMTAHEDWDEHQAVIDVLLSSIGSSAPGDFDEQEVKEILGTADWMGAARVIVGKEMLVTKDDADLVKTALIIACLKNQSEEVNSEAIENIKTSVKEAAD